ncbi:putative PolB exonuclease-like 3'-5' exonuclease [Methylobacterium brachiatum]|jgi:predicted PolB exonuclease-like 3'-5' exonuclease|uniref:PolB exonuclease-like 3'-5' exonuclease n=1 Tax=Methylobacterium brachiatum TaxID=269660 RepID=A0AAJ1WWY7_9HYPH|nr:MULTISPECIES: 3'-5' exonuclease [Methylobacterium]MCB4801537.1 3'-5' exonuclease [Methylobacterium brachiatum]MCJ2086140.1 3'-5' exonuclease [Methylobacterium sp. E-005]MDQ0544255.1 putative PolB exonuclease-like 3'-5' exonuclease [Methylobacterium brachiatum]
MTLDPRRGVPSPGLPPRAIAGAAPARRMPQAAGRPAAPARPSRILCLDVETVPDAELVPEDFPKDRFPKPAWHRVVAISFAEARIEVGADGSERYILECCRSGGEADWSEERLLRGFWRHFAEGDFRLVSWNGRAFDLPVLLLRAFLYGIPTGAYFLRGDRWAGYANRYAPDYHSDVMELLSSYGAATRMGLDEMAVAMGLPGKAGEHGSNVEAMISEGRIERVRDYCETDVLNTLALYCRWSLLCGRSDVDGHDASLSGMVEYLSAEREARPHLGAFLDRWHGSARPAPMMLKGSSSIRTAGDAREAVIEVRP